MYTKVIYCYYLAIKTGRYSYQKRAQNIMEVKGLTTFEAPPQPKIRRDNCSEVNSKVLPRNVEETTPEYVVGSPDSSRHQATASSDINELEDIISTITSVHLKNTVFTAEFKKMKSENERKYLVCCSVD